MIKPLTQDSKVWLAVLQNRLAHGKISWLKYHLALYELYQEE